MSPELERLLALQAKDAELRAVQNSLASLPRREERVAAEVAAAEAALEAHRARLQELRLRRREQEKEAEALEAEERRFQSQTASVKTNDALRALQHEITLSQRKRSEIETVVLEGMEVEEGLEREAEGHERRLSEARERAEAERAEIAVERGERETERARLEAERETIAAELPTPLRSRYERVLRNRGDRAVVPLVKNACGGCQTAQPPQRLQEVRQGNRIVICEFCSRLLIGSREETP